MPPLQTRQLSSHCLVMRLSWPNRWSLRVLAGVAPLGVEQALGQVEEQRGGPHVRQVLEVEVDAFADDALSSG